MILGHSSYYKPCANRTTPRVALATRGVNATPSSSLPCVKGGGTRQRDGGIGKRNKLKKEIVMQRKHNKRLVNLARALRHDMTREEKHLWYDYLKGYDVKFLRQKVLGKYIADFYSAEAKLVIELDGGGHYTDEGIEYDEERTAFLEEYGIKVLRIPNNEIRKNFEGVCQYIDSIVRQSLSQQS